MRTVLITMGATSLTLPALLLVQWLGLIAGGLAAGALFSIYSTVTMTWAEAQTKRDEELARFRKNAGSTT